MNNSIGNIGNIGNKIICLIGESATGKTEIEKRLQEKGYSKAVSYTTRKSRIGEIDGEDYHFVNNGTFYDLDLRGLFVEKTRYIVNKETWWYGYTYNCLPKNKTLIVVINPDGVEQFLKNKEIRDRVTVIHIKSNLNDRINRYLQREGCANGEINGDLAIRLVHRLVADSADFDDKALGFLGEIDRYYTIKNNGMDKKDLEKVVEKIVEIIESK